METADTALMGSHPHFLWADLLRPQKIRKTTLIDSLRENILFCTLNKRELRYLSNLVYERVYQPNETIFQQDDRGFGMFIIGKGRVNIRTQSGNGELQVTALSRGSFFGELALVDPDNTRSATAIAAEKCILIGFFKPDLMEIIERRPAMGVKILFQLSNVLGRRLLETTEKITLLTEARGLGQVQGDVI